MLLSTGHKLGPYEILAPIGAGGMGEVYRARDTRLNRDVAIKVSQELFSDRFEREARAVAALNHPNICTLYDVGPNYFVMELIEGESPKGPLPPEEALHIARQIADALATAHENGIVHRDLKPGNVKIKPDGTVKVLDFGLAKTVEITSSGLSNLPTMRGSPTGTGMIIGTPAYMSPEQALGKAVDKRADIWAFGVVLYELLTGSRPFRGEGPAETLASVMKDEPDLTHIPFQARRLVASCLEKDPKKRLRDLGDVGIAIDDALNAPSVVGTTTQSGPRIPGRRSSRLVWSVLALSAIAAGFMLWKLSASLATPAPRVLRLALSLPASQGFVDVAGNPVLFTPDGSAIVYSGRGPRGNQLYYRRLDQLEGTALPGTDDACCTTISPSGEWIGFGSNSSSTVSKVSVHGGAPIALAKVAYQGGLSWGPDDSIFSSEGVAGLFRIPANGGPKQQIAAPNPARHELSWAMPMALPDGKSVLTMSYMEPRGVNLVKVRIADGQATDLEGESENPVGLVGGYLLFGRVDGTLGLVSFDPANTRSVEAVIPVLDAPLRRNSGVEASLSQAGDLVYVKAASRPRITFLDEQGRITRENLNEGNFDPDPNELRMSPDGRQIVIRELTDYSEHGELWLYDLVSGVRQPLTTGVNAVEPEWTPDGHRVLYIHRPVNGQDEAWWVPADRSGTAERLIAMPISVEQIVLSPDSRYAIVTAEDPNTGYDLYLVDLKGDRKPRPLERSPFDETDPEVSPDGRWLAYVSNESGHEEVYVRPFPAGGAHVQVSADGGSDPRWEKDSHGIVYHNADRFMKVRLAVGANVAVTRRDLLFTGPYTGYDLSPGGGFVALRPASADAEIIVVTNWLVELKAKLAKQ